MRPHSTRKTAATILAQLIILAAAVPELRIGPAGLVFTTYTYTFTLSGVGYPRVCELLALLFVAISTPKILKCALTERDFRINLIGILAYLGVLALILYYHKTEGWDRYRAGLLVPLGLYLAIVSQRFEIEAQNRIMITAVIAGLLGSLTVITQPWLPDLFPVINNYDTLDSSRFMGSGQSPAYQGTFLLLVATPLVAALRHKSSSFSVVAQLALLATIGVAVAMTGTRMCVVVYALLLFYAFSKSFKIAILSLLFGLSLLAISTLSSADNVIMLTLRGLIERATYVEIGRVMPWQVAFNILVENPILGIGNFEIAVARMGLDVPAHPQNIILGQALLGGIPILFMFVWIVYRVLRAGLNVAIRKNWHDKIRQSTARALAIVYLCSGTTEIVDASIQVQIGFFLLIATASSGRGLNTIGRGLRALNVKTM